MNNLLSQIFRFGAASPVLVSPLDLGTKVVLANDLSILQASLGSGLPQELSGAIDAFVDGIGKGNASLIQSGFSQVSNGLRAMDWKNLQTSAARALFMSGRLFGAGRGAIYEERIRQEMGAASLVPPRESVEMSVDLMGGLTVNGDDHKKTPLLSAGGTVSEGGGRVSGTKKIPTLPRNLDSLVRLRMELPLGDDDFLTSVQLKADPKKMKWGLKELKFIHFPPKLLEMLWGEAGVYLSNIIRPDTVVLLAERDQVEVVRQIARQNDTGEGGWDVDEFNDAHYLRSFDYGLIWGPLQSIPGILPETIIPFIDGNQFRLYVGFKDQASLDNAKENGWLPESLDGVPVKAGVGELGPVITFPLPRIVYPEREKKAVDRSSIPDLPGSFLEGIYGSLIIEEPLVSGEELKKLFARVKAKTNPYHQEYEGWEFKNVEISLATVESKGSGTVDVRMRNMSQPGVSLVEEEPIHLPSGDYLKLTAYQPYPRWEIFKAIVGNWSAWDLYDLSIYSGYDRPYNRLELIIHESGKTFVKAHFTDSPKGVASWFKRLKPSWPPQDFSEGGVETQKILAAFLRGLSSRLK